MISTPLEERLCQIVSTVFDTPAGQVTPQTSRESLEPWDSLGHLVLVLELEQEFGVQLPPELVQQLNSVAEIAEILETEYGVRA